MAKSLTVLRYECDSCGLCCRKLIVEAETLDVLREPRIAAECKLLDGKGTIPLIDAAWMLAPQDSDNHACTFLCENRCSIYPTRPNVCVSFEAGSAKCQQLRKDDGRKPLKPTKVEATVENRLRAELFAMEE